MLDSAFWPRSSSVTNSSKLSLCVSNSLHVQILTSKCGAFSNLLTWSNSLVLCTSIPVFICLYVSWGNEWSKWDLVFWGCWAPLCVIHSVVSDRLGRLQLFIVLHLLLLCQDTQTKIVLPNRTTHTKHFTQVFPLIQALSIITHVHILARCSTPNNQNPCCNLVTAFT